LDSVMCIVQNYDRRKNTALWNATGQFGVTEVL
jgi:hypothetical protein